MVIDDKPITEQIIGQPGQKKWMSQYNPGNAGWDKGCHVDLGIFLECSALVFQTSVSVVHKREVCQRAGLLQ